MGKSRSGNGSKLQGWALVKECAEGHIGVRWEASSSQGEGAKAMVCHLH